MRRIEGTTDIQKRYTGVGCTRSALGGLRIMFLLNEAEKCRSDAEALKGTAEAPFLLKIALAFEELADLNVQLPPIPDDQGMGVVSL
jgi:hypothetical protein